jgi:hypothetical protein
VSGRIIFRDELQKEKPVEAMLPLPANRLETEQSESSTDGGRPLEPKTYGNGLNIEIGVEGFSCPAEQFRASAIIPAGAKPDGSRIVLIVRMPDVTLVE